MQFQHSWQSVISEQKTQTRRLVKPIERLLNTSDGKKWVDQEFAHHDRAKYIVGDTYAVQPARTHPALIYHPNHPCYGTDIIQPGDSHYQLAKEGKWDYRGQGYIQARIRITAIEREDVRYISAADALAEGFGGKGSASAPAEAVYNFLQVWTKIHDPAFQFWFDTRIVDFMWGNSKRDLKQGLAGVGGWDTCLDAMKQRPTERYQAWKLTFELVKE